jgi:hypothetical protein
MQDVEGWYPDDSEVMFQPITLISNSFITTPKDLPHTWDGWGGSLSDPPSLDSCKLSLSLSDREYSELWFGTTPIEWLCKIVGSLLFADSYWLVVSTEAKYVIPNFCPWESSGQNPCKTYDRLLNIDKEDHFNKAKLHNHPLGFGSIANRPRVFKLVKLTPLSTFFVDFASRNLSHALHVTTL